MKNPLMFILLFLFLVPVFSQTTVGTILLDKYPKGGEIRVPISPKKNQKYLVGACQFKKVKRNQIIDLYNRHSKKAQHCLVPLYSLNEYDVYIVLSSSILKESMKLPSKSNGLIIDIPNAFGFYLIYDRVNDSLIYLGSSTSSGSISISDNKSITVTFSFSNLYSNIIKLNDNFMPVSSFSLHSNTVSNTTLFNVSNYYLDHETYRVKTKKFINTTPYPSLFKIAWSELQSYLNTKLTDFDDDKLACDTSNCDADISRWFIPYN